ncbi:MAG TPA: hypothetical protein VLS27_03835 [Gammaproteobacteria bacterium]|nr:hypothetical protein [Gammaproteobacteria bacterium]
MQTERTRIKKLNGGILERYSRRLAGILLTLVSAAAFAGQASIQFVRFEHQGDGAWRVSVTLIHADSGWDHYADAWRVVAADGSIIGTRTLYHPHVKEQPFTRSLDGIKPPEALGRVYVEAHDSVHGWNPERLEVDLNGNGGDRFVVKR